MTDRLYYTDPYLRTFDATIQRVEQRDGRWLVTLDRTAFYPTTGGQPFDTGTLGDLRVVDVVDEEDGTISHLLSGSDPVAINSRGLTPGQPIHGEIDWARRFDHMQQHTGQHVLSAAIVRVCRVRTVSFHLGAAASTIDLERELSPAEIAAAETEANRVVWENRPVTIRFVTAEEAAALPLRKEPARGGTLRLIDVEEFDLSACGGTHVARSGAIGIIAVAAWERFKGGQRIEFLCGGRALGRLGSLRDTTAASVRLLSVLPEEIPSTVERLQAEIKDQKRAVAGLQTELARFRAAELAASAERVTNEISVVLRAIDADANGLKALASAVTAVPGHAVVLVSTSRPALVVAARSAGLAVSAQQIVAALTGRFGGRGGGKPELAQAGGLDAPAQDILDAAREALGSEGSVGSKGSVGSNP
jgi:alanyl-tRNA synthetase